MEYKDLEIIKSGYEGLHSFIIPAMLDDSRTDIRRRQIPTINPIIWMAWHVLRTEDMFLSNVIFRTTQLFNTQDWMTQLGIITPHVGTGMSAEQADQLALDLNLSALNEYNKALKEHSLNLLELVDALETNDLDPAEDIASRLKAEDAFPNGVLEERAKAYAPSPVSICLLGVINHGYMHFGQYLALTKPL